jgi:hypothetical protein
MISVHNNWDKLEEVWLGDVYPQHFYDDLEPDVRDSFYELTEWTKQDLSAIQKKLEEFGVVVRRPKIDGDKSQYLFKNKFLLKPPICPRDENAVVGNKLFVQGTPNPSYEPLKELYPKENVFVPVWRENKVPDVQGSSLVKIGKDLIFDRVLFNERSHLLNQQKKEAAFKDFYRFSTVYQPFFSEYRLHYSTNGGHVDACFMPVKPGLVLTTRYWVDYERILPGWRHINIQDPTWVVAEKIQAAQAKSSIPKNGSNDWVGYINSLPRHFNAYVKKYCKEWIGNYKETFFEVNTLMLDENNIMCTDTVSAYDPLYEELERNGVKVHIVPWRTRGFWDGGIHCITLDVRRKGTIQDYFPDRGGPGLTNISCNVFGNNTNLFLEEFNQWKKDKQLG